MKLFLWERNTHAKKSAARKTMVEQLSEEEGEQAEPTLTEEAAAAAVGQQHGNDYAEDAPVGAAGSEPGAAAGEQAKKEAEASLRAAMPFWLQTADPAKLGPAIEAAKKAGVAAQTVATAEAKLTEAVSKAAKAAEEKERKEAEAVDAWEKERAERAEEVSAAALRHAQLHELLGYVREHGRLPPPPR